MLNQGNERWKKKPARIQEIGKLSLSYCGMSVNHEMKSGWETQGRTWSYEGRVILRKGYKI